VRIGVVIPASVEKSAAKRNFWKRQAKAALALMAPKEGKDILLMFFPAVRSLTRKRFANEVAEAAARVGLAGRSAHGKQ